MKGIKYVDMFSGCRGFRLALERAGIPVERCVAVENDKFANRVSRYHYPNDYYLGDIRDVRSEQIIEILEGKPDFVTGGYPCQDNSNIGKCKGQKKGNRSGLVHELVRLIDELRPKAFLVENVTGLGRRNRGVGYIETMRILSFLQQDCPQFDVESYIFDSRHWTGQSRQRYYFYGRRMGQKSPGMVFPFQRKTTVHITKDPCQEKKVVDCINASFGRTRWLTESTYVLEKDGRVRTLSILECEKFQGLEKRWTESGINEKGKIVGMSTFQRLKMIGNAVTVDVVVDQLKKMKELGHFND